MLLQNSLYLILKINQTSYTIRFDALHPIFAGHFPGQPIVPGACLVQIAEELVSFYMGAHVRFTFLKNLKFRQPVKPDQEVIYTLSINNQSVNVQLSTFNGNCAQFTATYMRIDSDL